MKTLRKLALLASCLFVASVTSCVSDGLTEGSAAGAGKVAALDQQAASIEVSIQELNVLQAVSEDHEALLDEAVKALESHVAALRSGAPLMEGTMATFAQQKKLAEVIGSIEVSDEDGTLRRQISSLEEGVCEWVGRYFDAYYPAAKAEALAAARLAGLDLKKQKIYVEAILSDVEAGLRKDADKKELAELAAAMDGNVESAEELAANLSAITAEVAMEYTQAVETAVTDPETFDLPALKSFNSAVTRTLAEADNTLAGLIARVEACELQLADIKARLEDLEGTVGELKELLDMIQSVNFMSEFSDGNAVAYYDLGPEYRADGKMARNPHSSVDLNFIIRPAAAAEALTNSELWDGQMKVFGYYAGRIMLSAVNMLEFDITDVTADSSTGIVTVTVSSATLDESFYFKETGAKLALSIATGKTDLTSKFVEVVPKDASGTVYVEALNLSTDYVEVDCDLTSQLKATLAPEEPTDATLIWTSSDNNIATVSGTGQVTAKTIGEADITVTTKSTDEWGQTLSKTCRVKVLPNIKLEAANYVEVGGTITINVKSPNYIDKQYIKWSSSNTYYATVDEDGVVTGAVSTYDITDNVYDKITITCTIGDYMPTVLTHTMPVVVPQPKAVRFNSLDDGVEQKTIKIAEEFSLAGEIVPDAAASNFRLFYQAAGGGNEAVASINHKTGAVTAKSPGSVTFMARVLEDEMKYYYPRDTEVWRWVTVNVEPYWVNTISLPETLEMAPETSATLSPEFTSDVDGVQPTYKTVTWTSSDPSKVSVNAETGELKAIAEGTVYITATTNNTWAVPEGESQKSATCVVTVKAPTVAINVGDFFYSDGTWSTERDNKKTVIGVIFSTVNAVPSDPLLMRDYPECSHGLVVGLQEYESQFGICRNQGAYANSIYDASGGYGISSYGAVLSETLPTGYGLTLAYGNYRENIKSSSDYEDAVILFDQSTGVAATQNTDHSVAEGVGSAWYIPSKAEMNDLYTNKSKVNETLSAAGGTTISDERYWSAYLYDKYTNEGSKYHDCYAYPIDMSNGTWINNADYRTSYKVRVIFAF